VIIKLLLLASLAGAAVVVVRGRRTALSLLVRRALLLAAILAGAAAVLSPDSVTEVAELVGVGRGTDLVLYVLAVTFLFVTIGLHMRLAEMHDKYVALARQLALHEAEAAGRAESKAALD